MGFLFGLMMGTALTSGGNHALPPMLNSIPFRCLAAFEISDSEYRDCRKNSIRRELYEGTPCLPRDMDKSDGPCSESRALNWEIAGLHELKKAMEAKN